MPLPVITPELFASLETQEGLESVRSILWDHFVPASGDASCVNGELIRAVGRLGYEYHNNGNCNAREEKYKRGSYGDRVETGDYEINEMYADFLSLVGRHLSWEISPVLSKVKKIILDPDEDDDKDYFSEENEAAYNDLSKAVVTFVLSRPEYNTPDFDVLYYMDTYPSNWMIEQVKNAKNSSGAVHPNTIAYAKNLKTMMDNIKTELGDDWFEQVEKYTSTEIAEA